MSSTIPDTLERHPPCPNKAFFIMYAADRSIEETALTGTQTYYKNT